MAGHGLRSLVLIEGDRCHVESAAALRIARHLAYPWPAAAAFLLVPAFIQNAVYRIVAANRYRWFGKRDVCVVPTPKLSARFLKD